MQRQSLFDVFMSIIKSVGGDFLPVRGSEPLTDKQKRQREYWTPPTRLSAGSLTDKYYSIGPNGNLIRKAGRRDRSVSGRQARIARKRARQFERLKRQAYANVEHLLGAK